MKVAHIDFGFSYPAQGGEQLRVDSVCNILAKKHGVRVFFPSPRADLVLQKPNYSIESFNYHYDGSKRERIFPKNPAVIRDIYPGIKAFDADVIHHHFGAMPSLINAIFAGKRIGIPQIATFHQFWPLCYRGSYWDFDGNVCLNKNECGECMLTIPLVRKTMSIKWKRTTHLIFREISHFISYSKFMKNKLTKTGVEEERITVIPFGVDFKNIDGEERKRKYIVFSGRASREKGVDLFLNALSRMKNTGFEAIIIGDGPQKKEYEEMAAKLKVDVRFTGWINDRKTYFEYIKRSICVVVPSVWIENSPLVIGEAFACETPVIGTNSGGIPELINDSGAGFVVERDPDEIAEKIKVLIDNPKLREEMGKKGRAYAEKHFNWERNVEKLVKVYEKVLRKR